MKKIGILLHVYHLEAPSWEDLVWGDPEKDRLGTLPTFVDTLLGLSTDAEIEAIVYSGPSEKDGLIEGAYTKKFLLKNLDRLQEFSRLKEKLDALDIAEYEVFSRRVHDLKIGTVIANTLDEVTQAAKFFKKQTVGEVVQIAAASHAPRCLLNQLKARDDGVILEGQQWRIVASDTYFTGATADDVTILEPSHRGDDPMTGYAPSLASAIKPYFKLSGENKKELIRVVSDFLNKKT